MTWLNERGLATWIEVALVAGILLILGTVVFNARPQRFIVVSTTQISMSQNQTVTFTAALLAKGWGFGPPTAVGGTIGQTGARAIVQVTPSPSAPAGVAGLTFTIIAYARGTGVITVTGSSSFGTHDAETVKLEVG